MTRKRCSDFLVASCTEDGGVYCYRLYDDGYIEKTGKIPLEKPMYLAKDNGRFFAVLRSPFKENDHSGIVSFDIESNRVLCEPFSTNGEVGCHIAVDGDEIFCANYIGGNIFKFPSKSVFHTGSGTDKERQTAPHPHSAVLSPDKRFLLSCDLGLDKVFVYDRDLNFVSATSVPNGVGPRHLLFSKNGNFVYCANEMGGSVSIFYYENGTLDYVRTVSVLPDGYLSGACAAIKLSPSGSLLYVTERRSQTIVTLSANGDDISVLSRTECHGEKPRDFTLLANGLFAVCTNQFSGNVALFKIGEDGIPYYLNGFDIPAPLCAIEK